MNDSQLLLFTIFDKCYVREGSGDRTVYLTKNFICAIVNELFGYRFSIRFYIDL